MTLGMIITSREFMDLAQIAHSNHETELASKLFELAYKIRELESKELLARPDYGMISGVPSTSTSTSTSTPTPETEIKDKDLDLETLQREIDTKFTNAEEDSEKWAKEYITTPTDTPPEVAEKWQERVKMRPIEKKVLDYLNNIEVYNKEGRGFFGLSKIAEGCNSTVDQVMRALEWLKYKKLLPAHYVDWHDIRTEYKCEVCQKYFRDAGELQAHNHDTLTSHNPKTK